MKANLYTILAILLVGLTASGTARADVKIKARQTMSGQTMENTTLIKGKRQRTEMMNGKMISITQCDMRRDIQINEAAQTYLVSMFDDGTVSVSKKTGAKTAAPTTKGGVITMLVTTKDTGERKQMFGYTARHIITTMEMNSSPDACSIMKNKMQTDGWYIDAEFALDCAQNRSYANNGMNDGGGGCQDRSVVKNVGAAVKKGYPVLETMTMLDESGSTSFTSTTEVIEISKATLDPALFDVPAGYREAKNSTELYAAKNNANSNSTNKVNTGKSSMKLPDAKNSSNQNSNSIVRPDDSPDARVKREGIVRIGITGVKVGAVGKEMNGQQLSDAVLALLGSYLEGSKIELVPLDAKLASVVEKEAKEKECDFVLQAQVSHKKGGGGFGMFKAIAPVLTSMTPLAGIGGGIGGMVASSVASNAISSAANASANIKPKDEISLDIKLMPLGGAVEVSKQFKAKAKSEGEDIISPMMEQAAQAIIDSVVK